MSLILGIEAIELLLGIGASVGVASILSALRDYLNKKEFKKIKIGYKDLQLSGIKKEDIEKILEEISKIKKAPQVFVMYSHDEKELTKKICNDLEQNGIKIWLDEQKIKIGDSLSEKLKSGLNESQWIIFIPPKKSNSNNSWISKELEMVKHSEKWKNRYFVIPIKTKEGIIPEFLNDRVWVDFSENYDEGIQKLIKGILRYKDDVVVQNTKNNITIEIAKNGIEESEDSTLS